MESCCPSNFREYMKRLCYSATHRDYPDDGTISPEEYERMYFELYAATQVALARSMSAKIQRTNKECIGVVYGVLANGLVKIGKTKSYSRDRILTRYRVHNPDAELVAWIETNNVDADERSMHKHFVGKRKSGEWFALSADDIAMLRNLACVEHKREDLTPGWSGRAL